MSALSKALTQAGFEPYQPGEDEFEVLFLQHFIKAYGSYSNGYSNCNEYRVFCQGKSRSEYTVFTFWDTYSDCCNGETSASEGYWKQEMVYSVKGQPQHFLPKSTLFVHTKDKNGDIILVTQHGDTVVGVFNSGNCWYPEGEVLFEGLKLFEPTSRYLGKRKVFVVSGPSMVGKSTLFPDGLELESLNDLQYLEETLLVHDVIICSPKSERYVVTKAEVLSILANDEQIQVVEVNMAVA